MYFSFRHVGTRKLKHPISHPSRSPLLLYLSSFLPLVAWKTKKKHASPFAARTMARIVNLRNINREIKSNPKFSSIKCQILRTDAWVRVLPQARNNSRGIIRKKKKLGIKISSDKLGAVITLSLYRERVVRWSWKIFRKYVSIHSSRITIGGKLTPGEKISGETVLPRFLTIVIALTRHAAPHPFAFATRALFFAFHSLLSRQCSNARRPLL